MDQATREKLLDRFRAGDSIRAAARAAGSTYYAARAAWAESGGRATDPISDGLSNALDAAPLPASDDEIIGRMRKGGLTLAEIADALRVSPSTGQAGAWVSARYDDGWNIHEASGRYHVVKAAPPVQPAETTLRRFKVTSNSDNTFTLGAMGDTHLGSKYERLDVLFDLYRQYEQEGVEHVFHTGNWIDGEAKFNRYDLKVHGQDEQVRYLVEKYPRVRGVATYAVTGDDHEGWYGQKSGVDIGRYAERAFRAAGRTDWHCLGYMEAYVELVNANSGKTAMLHVVHPGGGSAYATSYTAQKLVESYSGGSKPAAAFIGHYHKMELINIRNVWVAQTGCTQDQTPFARKKKLDFHLGGHVIRFRQDPRTGALVEMNGMKRYFNVGYYDGRWSNFGPVVLPPVQMGGVG